MSLSNQKTIVIGGGSGLIGLRLSKMLQESGYRVLHLSRRANPNAIFPAFAWDLDKGTIDEEAVAQADYIINLAGAGIADKPWTSQRKRVIIESRVKSTRLLLQTFEKLGKKPKAYLSSTAIGIYGNTGENLAQEFDPPGTGFLAESCITWEKAIDEVAITGVRTVGLRIGIVLSTKGGALEKFLIPLNFFTAAYFGKGKQWYSWIHLDDACRMFLFAIENEQMQGYYNAVAPHPERNKNFTQQIVKALGKPALIMSIPDFVMRLVIGEMADTVLNSSRISSAKIEAAGFTFQFPKLQEALKNLLKK
ncbi:MAG: TIGR01777 family oxidoreductase [Saprospiraceae bacterium]|nr:TIGR01777 family oxidoreductase [Saprospiraceae bacterium]